MPENTLLSHDLFEGLFARAALVTDIELFEDFPARYEVAAARQHRWARGDWQLLPWLIRGAAGDRRLAGADSHDRPLEDARQSEAHAVGSRRLPHARARLDPAGRRTDGVDQAGAALSRGAGTGPGVDRSHPATARRIQARLPARHRHDRGARRGADRARAHLARAPGLAHGRCGRAHLAPARRHAPADARMGHRRAGEVERPARSCPDVRGDVGRPRAGARRGGDRRVELGRHARSRGGVRRPLGPLARGGSLDQPSDGHAAPRAADRRRAADHPDGGATELALLRDVRDRRRQLAAAGQFPGRSRGRSSRTAPRRPTWASICSRRWRRGTSASSARSTRSIGSGRPWRRSAISSAIAGTSTTGTTRKTSSPSSRGTCPRSTAAISPGISASSRSRRASASGVRSSEPRSSVASTRRCSCYVTRFRPTLAPRSTRSAPRWVRSLRRSTAWPNRLVEMATAVRGLGERAKALPEDTGAEAVVWADVAQATIASHRRDLDAIVPWIEGLDDLRRSLPAERQNGSVVGRLLDAPPLLGDLPELARAAARELGEVDGGLGRQGGRLARSGSRDGRDRLARGLGACRRSAR